jgi:predicted Rossmann fold flavoprotein
MQVSRVAGNWERAKKGACTVSLDLFPDMREGELTTLLSRRRALKGRTLENFFTGFLNKRIGQTAIRAAGLALTAPVDSLTDDDVANLVKLLKNWTFAVQGTKGFAGAQVTAGGITANEFSEDTLESCYQKGIFAAGEVLNVDGDCGGFNLQFAFASAAVAAGGILRRLKAGGV